MPCCCGGDIDEERGECSAKRRRKDRERKEKGWGTQEKDKQLMT